MLFLVLQSLTGGSRFGSLRMIDIAQSSCKAADRLSAFGFSRGGADSLRLHGITLAVFFHLGSFFAVDDHSSGTHDGVGCVLRLTRGPIAAADGPSDTERHRWPFSPF